MRLFHMSYFKKINEESTFVCPDCEEQVSYNDETCSNCGFSISSNKWKKTKIGTYAFFYSWDGLDAVFSLDDIIEVEKYKKIKNENVEVFQLVETEYRSTAHWEGEYGVNGYVLNVKGKDGDSLIPDKEYGWYTYENLINDGTGGFTSRCTINELKFKSSNGSIVPVE